MNGTYTSVFGIGAYSSSSVLPIHRRLMPTLPLNSTSCFHSQTSYFVDKVFMLSCIKGLCENIDYILL